ncbi:AMP-dependent synthetase/ligase [Macrophomina phaseolina MS6]|uniref:AMP-dependent synthetase/ligase n=1 Tax=Macrophomina phaseolina (strain MS6) TaxID=1126212 RepID=K2QPW0_MACPH|nr:AMP-dependent synthetase/ligase [Macrophomina phaseolina MS6]
MKIVDEAGLDISGYDVPGEIWVRSPCVFMGYVDNPQANSVWDSDGYFPTGDIAYCSSKNKQWYVMDRKKEMIKVRSFQVAPAELEGVLLSHPQIADAGVIGVKASNDGSEFPRAYVVRKQSLEAASLKEDDVKKYVAERLASYKRLEGGLVFVNELPRSQTGKILKQILKERAARELGAKL